MNLSHLDCRTQSHYDLVTVLARKIPSLDPKAPAVWEWEDAGIYCAQGQVVAMWNIKRTS